VQHNQSEVARLKAEIELQSAAAHRAVYGLAEGTSQHSFITKKMERIGKLHDDLMGIIGERKATRFLVKTIDRC
jgi:hypothetical protein